MAGHKKSLGGARPPSPPIATALVFDISNFQNEYIKIHFTNRPAIRKDTKAVADPENFGWGDDKNFKHKTSKIRMLCNQVRSQKFAMEQLF